MRESRSIWFECRRWASRAILQTRLFSTFFFHTFCSCARILDPFEKAVKISGLPTSSECRGFTLLTIRALPSSLSQWNCLVLKGKAMFFCKKGGCLNIRGFLQFVFFNPNFKSCWRWTFIVKPGKIESDLLWGLWRAAEKTGDRNCTAFPSIQGETSKWDQDDYMVIFVKFGKFSDLKSDLRDKMNMDEICDQVYDSRNMHWYLIPHLVLGLKRCVFCPLRKKREAHSCWQEPAVGVTRDQLDDQLLFEEEQLEHPGSPLSWCNWVTRPDVSSHPCQVLCWAPYLLVPLELSLIHRADLHMQWFTVIMKMKTSRAPWSCLGKKGCELQNLKIWGCRGSTTLRGRDQKNVLYQMSPFSWEIWGLKYTCSDSLDSLSISIWTPPTARSQKGREKNLFHLLGWIRCIIQAPRWYCTDTTLGVQFANNPTCSVNALGWPWHQSVSSVSTLTLEKTKWWKSPIETISCTVSTIRKQDVFLLHNVSS